MSAQLKTAIGAIAMLLDHDAINRDAHRAAYRWATMAPQINDATGLPSSPAQPRRCAS